MNSERVTYRVAPPDSSRRRVEAFILAQKAYNAVHRRQGQVEQKLWQTDGISATNGPTAAPAHERNCDPAFATPMLKPRAPRATAGGRPLTQEAHGRSLKDHGPRDTRSTRKPQSPTRPRDKEGRDDEESLQDDHTRRLKDRKARRRHNCVIKSGKVDTATHVHGLPTNNRKVTRNGQENGKLPAGLALMQGFTAANVGRDRLTLKPGPISGVFNKGKASIKPLPKDERHSVEIHPKSPLPMDSSDKSHNRILDIMESSVLPTRTGRSKNRGPAPPISIRQDPISPQAEEQVLLASPRADSMIWSVPSPEDTASTLILSTAECRWRPNTLPGAISKSTPGDAATANGGETSKTMDVGGLNERQGPGRPSPPLYSPASSSHSAFHFCQQRAVPTQSHILLLGSAGRNESDAHETHFLKTPAPSYSSGRLARSAPLFVGNAIPSFDVDMQDQSPEIYTNHTLSSAGDDADESFDLHEAGEIPDGVMEPALFNTPSCMASLASEARPFHAVFNEVDHLQPSVGSLTVPPGYTQYLANSESVLHGRLEDNCDERAGMFLHPMEWYCPADYTEWNDIYYPLDGIDFVPCSELDASLGTALDSTSWEDEYCRIMDDDTVDCETRNRGLPFFPDYLSASDGEQTANDAGVDEDLDDVTESWAHEVLHNVDLDHQRPIQPSDPMATSDPVFDDLSECNCDPDGDEMFRFTEGRALLLGFNSQAVVPAWTRQASSSDASGSRAETDVAKRMSSGGHWYPHRP